jgi:hypothetical protein
MVAKRVLFIAVIVALLYCLAGTDDCPGKDLAQLSDGQRAEVMSRLGE